MLPSHFIRRKQDGFSENGNRGWEQHCKRLVRRKSLRLWHGTQKRQNVHLHFYKCPLYFSRITILRFIEHIYFIKCPPLFLECLPFLLRIAIISLKQYIIFWNVSPIFHKCPPYFFRITVLRFVEHLHFIKCPPLFLKSLITLLHSYKISLLSAHISLRC